MTPERKAKIEATLAAILGPKPNPRPKVVASDGAVISEAAVVVSPADPNAGSADEAGVVNVRRNDVVTICDDLALTQRAEADAAKRAARAADPYRLGLYGHVDD